MNSRERVNKSRKRADETVAERSLRSSAMTGLRRESSASAWPARLQLFGGFCFFAVGRTCVVLEPCFRSFVQDKFGLTDVKEWL